MSVSEMKLISIFGVFRDLNTVAKILVSSGRFQPDEIGRFYSNTDIFSRIHGDNIAPDSLKMLKNTLILLDKVPKTIKNAQNLSLYESSKFVNDLNKQVTELFKLKHATEDEMEDQLQNRKILENFSSINEKLEDIFSCRFAKAFFGKIPRKNLSNLRDKSSDDFVYKICNISENDVWLVYFANCNKIAEVTKIFSRLMFKNYDLIRQYKGTIVENLALIDEKIDKLNKNITETKNKIDEIYVKNQDKINLAYTSLKNEVAYCNIEKYAMKYGTGFVLVGWIPAESEKYFSEILKDVEGVEFTTESAGKLMEFSPPVKLQNKKFFRPFEFFTEMYGLPRYNEVDPTVLVAITYTLLFGVMFADFGQGIIIALAGWFMMKYKKMALGRPLIPCGIASSFFGIVFGSFFGFEHAFDWLYKALFGLEENPIEIMNPDTINRIIFISIGLGVVFMFIAMLANVYATLKTRSFAKTLFSQNGIFGMILYMAIIFLLLDKFLIKSGLTNIFYILGLIILPMFFIMNREIFEAAFARKKRILPESIGEYVAVNLFELIEVVLSFATNTMSFLRVGAFVVVHAGIMQVFFTIGQMFPAINAVILVLGNVFVIVLEGFLVGVQVMRLEFYELFSRFYEGGGREFKPIRVDS